MSEQTAQSEVRRRLVGSCLLWPSFPGFFPAFGVNYRREHVLGLLPTHIDSLTSNLIACVWKLQEKNTVTNCAICVCLFVCVTFSCHCRVAAFDWAPNEVRPQACEGPDPLSDSVRQSDQLPRETRRADQWNRLSFDFIGLVSIETDRIVGLSPKVDQSVRKGKEANDVL